MKYIYCLFPNIALSDPKIWTVVSHVHVSKISHVTIFGTFEYLQEAVL